MSRFYFEISDKTQEISDYPIIERLHRNNPSLPPLNLRGGEVGLKESLDFF